MTANLRLRAGLAGLAVVLVGGTTGYVVLEKASVLDSLYMVFITITTVGFGEVFGLSGAGKILTIVVMVLGVGLGLYTAGAGIEQLFIYGASRRTARILKMIERLHDHVVLCGFGRVGEGVLENLIRRDERVVVVEIDENRAERARTHGVPVVIGDATHNDFLRAAGIERAKALVSCVTEDSDNLVIVLSARSIHPTLHIVSRATEMESEGKLRLAGADRVVTPQRVGSERLAAMAVESSLTEVVDVVVGGRAIEFSIEEIAIPRTSGLVGSSIKEAGIRERTGAIILAVEDRARTLLSTPSPDHVLEGDTHVIVVGTRSQVQAAERLFSA